MAMTEALQIPDPFEMDDDQEDVFAELGVLFEAGNLGLHLGVLRRLAMLTGASDSIPPAVGR